MRIKRILQVIIVLLAVIVAVLIWWNGASPAQAQPPQQTATLPPAIPHPLQGRDNCLACHATGVGGAPVLDASHAGRTVDTCRGCHQPATSTAPPVVVPTPVAHTSPSSPSQDSCITCHTGLGGNDAKVVQDYQSSVHADRNVTCVDCHGGDATKTTKEAAMSPAAGFIGKPKTADIPALCASCHARVELMRQYDLATDQWSQYQQSVHGQKLAQGDTNVATCFVCHDGHATKKTDDPTSNVYAFNVPGLCASCHANAELMKPYNIPTNQYELYKQSVHGIALLQKQDTRAPTCATCHGTHGAAPPGFEEVANVCGSCHSATQDYYLKSRHASGAAGTPKCVTCHGRYDVGTPTDAMFIGNTDRDCTSCHPPGSAQSQAVQALYDSIDLSARKVSQAVAAVQYAASAGLITAPEEAILADAKTNLITARAAQHTMSLDVVKAQTDKANAKADEVVADAGKAVGDSVFRREVMGVGLAIMALSILSLYVIRRELYRRLPPK